MSEKTANLDLKRRIAEETPVMPSIIYNRTDKMNKFGGVKMSLVMLTNYKLSQLFYFFIVYSFIGWCIETVYAYLNKGAFVNRGFLYGPFLPIYGFGALIMIILLEQLGKNIPLLFISAVLLLSTFEYVTGYIFKNYFGRVLWDYSNKPLNINGHVWIGASLLWGFLGSFILVKVHPFIENLYYMIPSHVKPLAAGLALTYLVLDFTAASVASLGLNDRIIQAFQAARESGAVADRFEKAAVALSLGTRNVLKNIKTRWLP